MTANGEAFMEWALDAERTVEEKFSVQVLIEHRAREFKDWNWEQRRLEWEARRYNPAWTPVLNPAEVRKLAGKLEEVKALSFEFHGDRPLRNLEVLRFLPCLQELNDIAGVTDLTPLRHVPGLVSLNLGVHSEVTDLEPLAYLQNLKRLTLGGRILEDYRPVAKCARLNVIHVYCGFPWPRMEGWEALTELEELKWHGSALGFLGVKCLPALRVLDLECGKSYSGEGAMRDLGQLPQMPELRVLWARNFFHLDGVERYPKVHAALLGGPFRTAAPVNALPELTHLRLVSDELREVRSLTQAPALHELMIFGKRPQDYSMLAEAPQLREVNAFGCDAGQVDLGMLSVVLPPWDEYFGLEVPRPLGELEFIGPVDDGRLPEHPPVAWPVTEAAWERNPCFQDSARSWCDDRLRAALDAVGLHRDEGFMLGLWESHRQEKRKSGVFYANLPGERSRLLSLHLVCGGVLIPGRQKRRLGTRECW